MRGGLGEEGGSLGWRWRRNKTLGWGWEGGRGHGEGFDTC